MKKLLLLIFTIVLCDILQFVNGVQIYDAHIPPPVEFGREDEVVLNCDYDLLEEERGQLDIKWYFKDDVVPFLQWIPGAGRRPQLVQPTLFQGHVDLNFRVDDDEHKAYRSLKIVQPTLAMAGNYRCKVSTFEDEGFVEQQLSIYSLPKNMVLNHNIDSGGNLDVTCMVENVFPEPIIHLLWNESKLEGEEYSVDKRGGNCVSEPSDVEFEEYSGSGSGSGDYSDADDVGSTPSVQEEDCLLDITLRYQHDVNEIYHSSGPELSAIELGCEMALPEPFLDVMLVKKLQIQLGSGLEDGSSDDEAKNLEDEASGDMYDNDWLNVYNDTSTSDEDSEKICDGKTCDKENNKAGSGVTTLNRRSILLYQFPILILFLLLW